jgi:transcriptional regulator with XRE-family HTH domain
MHLKNILYGQKLRDLWIKSGKKQAALASELGLKRQQELSDYINGRLEFNSKLIERICIVFNISRSTFLEIDASALNTKSYTSDFSDSVTVPLAEKEWLELQILQKELELVHLKLKTACLLRKHQIGMPKSIQRINVVL